MGRAPSGVEAVRLVHCSRPPCPRERPVDAADLCLHWLRHFDAATGLGLLQICISNMERGDASADRQKAESTLRLLKARKAELVTYDHIIQRTEGKEWQRWQELDKACRQADDNGPTVPAAIVGRLVRMQLFTQAKIATEPIEIDEFDVDAEYLSAQLYTYNILHTEEEPKQITENVDGAGGASVGT